MATLHRRSTRLKNFDYSLLGAYFVTICTYQRSATLGKISDYKMLLSQEGKIVEDTWSAIPAKFGNVSLDTMVVMPNHVHGIILITKQEAGLNQLVAWFKYETTTAINRFRGKGLPVWQRSYYDHIIRNSIDLQKVRDYITGNPAKWAEDEYNRL